MTLSPKYLAAVLIATLIIGAAITRTFMPREVIKTQIQEHAVTVDHDVIKDHIVTVTKTIVAPNGTRETDTTTTTDKAADDTKHVDDVTKTSIIDTKASAAEKKWAVELGVEINPKDMVGTVSNPAYYLGVSRTIIGPVYMGGWIDTKTQGGLSLGLSF